MGRSRHRRPLLGRKAGLGRRSRTAATPPPRLGRRKALWRFVGALALAPLAGTSFGQAPVLSPAPGYGPPGAYAPGMTPPAYGAPGYGAPGYGAPGYGAPGYGPPGAGPMVAPPPASPQPMTPQNSGGIAIPQGGYSSRFGLTTGAGDGLGWENGYQSFNAWVPVGINTEGMVMYLDARGFASFDEAGGGNFTLGYRYYMPQFKRYVGVYGGYDIDAGNDDSSTFHQFVVGAESVGDFVSYRVNGYVPIGDTDAGVFQGQVGGPFFRGNNVLFLDRDAVRYQYGGVDGEIGGLLPLIGKYGVSGFVGGYYLTSDVDDTLGFKTRAEANINDDLQLGVKLTTDEIFDTNIWATLTLRTPRGGLGNFFRKDWLRPPSAETQMDRGPEREYRTFTRVEVQDTEVFALDPNDGTPLTVLHVDPNGGGSGTFESPAGAINGFNNPAVDIVYVRPGTLSTNGPVALFDNQRLLSTSVLHTFDSQRGTFLLPGSARGPLPVLQNISSTPSSVVQLAGNNEISGFALNGNDLHAGVVGTRVSQQTAYDINRNQFVNNAGAGFALMLAGSAEASVSMVRNQFLGVSDDSDPLTPYGGQGVFFSVTDQARFLDSTIDGNLFSGNESEGLLITADGLSTVRNVLIGNEDGDNNNGNVFTDNLNGIGLIRQGNARVDEVRIVDNEIHNNDSDGIDFRIGGGLLDIPDVVVSNNTIAGQGENGIFGIVQGNGILNLTLTDNILANNAIDGIQIQQDRFTIDEGGITGLWTGNIIADNLIHGIDIQAPMRDLVVGTAESGNIIARNAEIGVLLIGPGSTTFENNLIADNGSANTNITDGFTNGAGIVITNLGFKDYTFINNSIVDNIGDGVQIDARGNQFYELEFTGNTVARNAGRGFDVLNAGNSFMNLAMQSNLIGQNGEEGVYIVNTADADQTQFGRTPNEGSYNPNTDPSHGLSRGGAVTNGSFMNFMFTENTVVGNGTNGAFGVPGKGLVLRVGTGDGGFGGNFGGGFASDGLAGVVATVNNNFFSGNVGADVYVESFTSTVDPNSGTTWSATEFNSAGYQSDPLARLDLEFVGNTLEEANFNNLGAFYNNSDGTFKSRTSDADPPGPFSQSNGDTRRRNAQRLADRGGLPPGPGLGSSFQYPGMGESTFRVTQSTLTGTNTIINSDGTTTVVPVGAFFILDDQPFTGFFDANGVGYFQGPFTFGELPFGWSVAP